MSEDTAFFVTLAALAGVYFVFMMILEWFKGLFSFSGGGGYSGGGSGIANAIQRGDKIQITMANGSQTLISGELRGWSSQSVSFVDDSGNGGSYSANGSYTFHY